MLGLTLNEEINEPEPTVAKRPIPDPDFYVPPQLESPTEAPTEPLRACSPFADMDARQVEDLIDPYIDDHDEIFCNGLDSSFESYGPTFHSRVETSNRRANFIESNNWHPSSSLSALPFIWAHRHHGRPHHFNDLYMANAIVAKELGFLMPYEYIECRGWTLSKRRSKIFLLYRRLPEAFFRNAPSERSASLSQNFHAMIECLYKILYKETEKHLYTEEDILCLLQMDSFMQKLHNFAQSFQIGMIIVKTYFLPHAPTNKGDLHFWMTTIFMDIGRTKDYALFCDNIFSLFQEKGGKPELAKSLLTEYKTCIRDQVCRLSASPEHKRKYSDFLEEKLNKVQRGTRAGQEPLADTTLLLARC